MCNFKHYFHRPATSVSKGTESRAQPKETNTHAPAYIAVENTVAGAQKQWDTTTRQQTGLQEFVVIFCRTADHQLCDCTGQ